MHHTPQPRSLADLRPGFRLGMGGADRSTAKDNARSFNARLSQAPTPTATAIPKSDDLTEAIETITDYLGVRNFPYTLRVEDFMHLQPSQARDLCHFLFTRLDPAASIDSLEEDLPNLLRLLKYPATVTKSQLKNSPQRGTEAIISAFCWLIKIFDYIETCLPELSASEFLSAILEAFGDCGESRSSCRVAQDRQCVLALSRFAEETSSDKPPEILMNIEASLAVEQSDLDQLIFLLLRSRKLVEDETETEQMNQRGIYCYQYMLRVMRSQLEKRQEMFANERAEVVRDIARIHGHMNDLDKLLKARNAFESDTVGVVQQIASFKKQVVECQQKLSEAQQALALATSKADEQEHRTNLGRAEAEAQEDRAAEVERLKAGIRDVQEEIKTLEKDQTACILEWTRLTATLHEELEPMSREWQKCLKQLYSITEVDDPEVDKFVKNIRNTIALDASDIGERLKIEKWFEVESLMRRYESDSLGEESKPEHALRTLVELMQEFNSALERETIQNLTLENYELEKTKRKLRDDCTTDLARAQARVRESTKTVEALKVTFEDLRMREQESRNNLKHDEAEIDSILEKKEKELAHLLQMRAARRSKMKSKHYRDDQEIGDLCEEILKFQLELLDKIRIWEEETAPQMDEIAEEEIMRYTRKLPSQLQGHILRQSGWCAHEGGFEVGACVTDEYDGSDVENVPECVETSILSPAKDPLLSLAERAMMQQQATPTTRRRPRAHPR